jgi:ligand-binding sensor domain-containing protein
MLWIGTYNGLNQFDGSNFLVYKKRRGSNSIVNEVVHSLCEDKKGNIWGATDNGVFCYQQSDDRFINYAIKSNDTRSYFFNIRCDKQGSIWTTSNCSLFKFNSSGNKFDKVLDLTNNPDSVIYFQIRKNGFQPDPSGKGLWMTTRLGIFYYDISEGSLLSYNNRPDDVLFAKRSATALSISPSGKMWFCNNTQKELISFDPSSRKILQRINIGNQLSGDDGSTIFEDRNQRLWFCSWNYHLLVIDLQNGNKIQSLKHRAEDNQTVANQFFWAAFQDDDGTIWLGTLSGISRCNPEATIYSKYHLSQKIKELNGTSIQLAEQDPVDKSFWLLTSSQLLIHYNPQNEKYESFNLKNAEDGTGGVKPGGVNRFKVFKDRLIITTYTGAWQIKKGTNKISPYDYLPTAFKDFKCAEIVADGDSVLYFSDGKQILQWNYVLDSTWLLRFPPDPSIPTDRTIIAGIVMSPDHNLWMASLNGYIAYKNHEYTLSRVKTGKR